MAKKEISLNNVPEQKKDESDNLSKFQDKFKSASNDDILNTIIQLPAEQILPWETVQLPSRGVYYEGAIPDGYIEIRPMGLSVEKMLATQRLAQSGQSIEQMFRQCVRFPNPDFDTLNLLSGDRTFILYYIRGITHGNLYDFGIECSNESCGVYSTHTYDLNDLADTIQIPDSNDHEPFKVVLPHLTSLFNKEIWVSVRLLRGYDTQTIMNRRKLANKIQGTARTYGSNKAITVDQAIEEHISILITDVLGSTDRDKINEFVKKLHSKDSAVIREFIREKMPGVNATIEVTCPECGVSMKMELPITESFFRPAKSGGK